MCRMRSESRKSASTPPSTPRTDPLQTAALGLAALSPFVPAAVALLLPDFGLLQTSLGFFAAVLSASLLLVGFARRRGGGWAPGGSVAWRQLALGAALVGAVVVTSACLAVNPVQALTYGAEGEANGAPMWLASLIVTVLAARTLLRPASRRWAGWAVALASVCAAVALAEAARGLPVTGGFGNADYLGMVLLLLVPIALAGARESARSWMRAASAIAAIVMSTAVVLGGSLAATVALLCEWTALALLVPELFGPRDVVRGVGAAVAAVGGLAGASAVAVCGFYPQSMPARFATTVVMGPTTQTRLAMWRIAWDAWRARPVFGWGPDGLQFASQRFMTLDIVRMESSGYSGVSGLLRDPHSMPLLVLASLGVVGAAAAVVLVVAWARAACVGPRSAWRDACVVASLAFAACLLVMPWNDRFSALPGLVAGLAIAPAPPRNDTAADASEASSLTRRTRALVRAGAWGIALLALVLGSTYVAADVLATRALSSSTPNVAMLRLANYLAPARPYLRYAVLYAEGQQLEAGRISFTQYRSEVDGSPSVTANGVYSALLAQPALDAYRLTRNPSEIVWARGQIRSASLAAPNDPDVILEGAHLAALAGDSPGAESRLQLLAAANVRRPRMLLYAYYASAGAGRRAEADGLREMLAVQQPGLLTLAR
jgi:O-antigen ligase